MASLDPNSEKSLIFRIKPDWKTVFFPESGSVLAKNPDPIRKIRIQIHDKKHAKSASINVFRSRWSRNYLETWSFITNLQEPDLLLIFPESRGSWNYFWISTDHKNNAVLFCRTLQDRFHEEVMTTNC